MTRRIVAPSGDAPGWDDIAARVEGIAPLTLAELGKLHWLTFNLQWQLADARRALDVLSDTIAKLPKGLR